MKIKPLPSPRLMHFKETTVNNNMEGILFVSISIPRYFYRFNVFRHYDVFNYFDCQRRFYNAVVEDVRKKITVRLCAIDYGWDCRERWLDLDKTIPMDDISVPFFESIKKYRLTVHDHSSGSFFETLAINKPSIFFWDQNIFSVRSEALPFFEKLRESGILFFSPEEAAKAVSKVYYNVEEWWLNSDRQHAREEFCKEFVIFSTDSIKLWSNEFLEIIKEEN